MQTDLYAGLPPIHGNSGKLQQVFLNLFLNAKDAMAGKGGTLYISTANGDSVEVNITDRGAGIAPEHIKQIYDPFFTTKNGPREGQKRGTGLGLSVTYGIIQEHAGKIHVDQPARHHVPTGISNEEGCQCLKPRSYLAPRPTSPSGGSILIIDDEAGIRESLETLLEFEGYSVESAETGEDGLARLSEHTFDLVCSTLPCRTATDWKSWRHPRARFPTCRHHDHRLRHGR